MNEENQETRKNSMANLRDLKNHSPSNLTWKIPRDQECFRFLPRHGKPASIYEWVIQKLIKLIAWLPVYIAIVVTLTFLVVLFGFPCIGGSR